MNQYRDIFLKYILEEIDAGGLDPYPGWRKVSNIQQNLIVDI